MPKLLHLVKCPTKGRSKWPKNYPHRLWMTQCCKGQTKNNFLFGIFTAKGRFTKVYSIKGGQLQNFPRFCTAYL